MAEIIVSGEPANAFEKTVARTLGHLPEPARVLTNLVLPSTQSRFANIEVDAVVLTTHAVYVIEVKYWQGEVEGHINRKHWLVHREGLPPHQVENPLQRTEIKAKTVNTLLSRWNSGLMGRLPTLAVVVLPPHTPTRVENPTEIDLVGLEALLPHIEANANRLPHEARADQLEQMVTCLAGEVRSQIPALPFAHLKVDRVLSSGDRHQSYEATNTLTGRKVFVRRIPGDVNLAPHAAELARSRAVREARATMDLNHPGVIRVLDVLEEQGDIYVLAEWILGRSVLDAMTRDDIPGICKVVRTAACILGEIHQSFPGMVHRGLTPGCLLVTEGGVRVTGFGVARVPGDPTIVFGELIQDETLPYMAPELLQPGAPQADPRADVYGLGAILYHLLAGRPPVPFLSREPTEPLGGLVRLPVGLEELITRTMHPLPGKRPPTMEAFAESLVPYCGV
ncbi:MAG: NERD domain-containing protein [Candidatus Sericytochromatia bacterium]|nr:NERD domain-containing protein [Candidatus Sericytochromatia bacterium]